MIEYLPLVTVGAYTVYILVVDLIEEIRKA
jgi:hypothetical protein